MDVPLGTTICKAGQQFVMKMAYVTSDAHGMRRYVWLCGYLAFLESHILFSMFALAQRTEPTSHPR